MLQGNLKRAAITRGEELGLVACTAPPDWADGVNDVGGFQPIAGRDLGIADVAAAKALARLQQLRPSRIVNGSVNTPAAEQGRIRGIDDSVDAQRGNICV